MLLMIPVISGGSIVNAYAMISVRAFVAFESLLAKPEILHINIEYSISLFWIALI